MNQENSYIYHNRDIFYQKNQSPLLEEVIKDMAKGKQEVVPLDKLKDE